MFRYWTKILTVASVSLIAASPTAGATEYRPGDVFRDCDTCPELVVVPAGAFVMGLGGRYKQELPEHRVKIARPFAIGRYEVTFDEWQACLDAGACEHEPDDHKWGRGRRPVINLTFKQMKGYVAWLSAETGETYRLPSDAEWEYAARDGTVTEFWWGDEVGENLANCRDCGAEWSGLGSAPVGSFEANPYGLFDTAGNVWEWVEDCWNPNHENAPADGSARTDGDCGKRVIRGGSWYYVKKNIRSAWRFKNDARVKSYWLGFRVARELP